MSSHDKEIEVPVVPADQSKIKKIWLVAGVLALVTLIEYAFAFSIPAAGSFKYLRIILFVALTVVKAYYIMKEFMHLGHEKQSLQNAIIFPLVFLAWIILAFLMEANYILDGLAKYWDYLP